MVTFLSCLNDLRKYLYKIQKKKNNIEWEENCQRSFEHIKKLLISAPLLGMPMVSDKFMLESDICKTATGGALFQFQRYQSVLIGNHSKLPHVVCNYGITESVTYRVSTSYSNINISKLRSITNPLKCMKMEKELTGKRLITLLLNL